MREYTVHFLEEEKLRFRISCKELESDYYVSQGWLRLDIDFALWRTCGENSLDAIFINDLRRVVDYRVADNKLILELGGSAGAMFFSPLTDSSE